MPFQTWMKQNTYIPLPGRLIFTTNVHLEKQVLVLKMGLLTLTFRVTRLGLLLCGWLEGWGWWVGVRVGGGVVVGGGGGGVMGGGGGWRVGWDGWWVVGGGCVREGLFIYTITRRADRALITNCIPHQIIEDYLPMSYYISIHILVFSGLLWLVDLWLWNCVFMTQWLGCTGTTYTH